MFENCSKHGYCEETKGGIALGYFKLPHFQKPFLNEYSFVGLFKLHIHLVSLYTGLALKELPGEFFNYILTEITNTMERKRALKLKTLSMWAKLEIPWHFEILHK